MSFFVTLSQLADFHIQSVRQPARRSCQVLKRVVLAESIVRAARDTYSSVAASVARLPNLRKSFRTQRKRRLMQQVELFTADIGACWIGP
jgi:hypothetical protein